MNYTVKNYSDRIIIARLCNVFVEYRKSGNFGVG